MRAFQGLRASVLYVVQNEAGGLLMVFIAWVLAVCPVVSAMPVVPAVPTLTPAEQATLASGEIVFRYPGPYTIQGIVYVAAPIDAVIASVVDLPPRLAENGGMLSLETYAARPGYTAAKWELGVSFYTVWIHLEYAWDTAAGWCSYGLDENMQNDTHSSEGWYKAVAHGEGSRLFYQGTATGPFVVPTWLRKRISTNATVDLLVGIRARAEGGTR
jgi:hypothetical protein